METIKILLFILPLIYFFLILFCVINWVKGKTYLPKGSGFSTFTSILIPARNEEENICHILRDISSQNYPKNLFEIIVIDDGSKDKTVQRACEFLTSTGLNHKILQTDKNCNGKKKAIEMGINGSVGELIITTDADCRIEKNWLATIVSFYEEKKPEMIIGPVVFHDEKSVFEKMQSLEFLSLGAITGATGIAGHPLMCNGANLAYTKKGFIEVGGFEGNEQIPSGDDILLMIKFKKHFDKKVHYLKSKEAFVFTRPQRKITEFIDQRMRWVSKSRHYSDVYLTFVSWFILIFNFSIPVYSALFFMKMGFGEILMVSFSIKLFFDFLFLFLTASFFSHKSLLWLFVPVQVLYIFYVPAISIASLIGTFTWKGRQMVG